jgi:hypothetical protein
MFLVEIDNSAFNPIINDTTTLHLDAQHLRAWLKKMRAQKIKSTREYAVWMSAGDKFITVYRNKRLEQKERE